MDDRNRNRRIEIRDAGPASIAAMLADRGYRTRLVGGAVRDCLAGSAPKDMDLATDALPHAVCEAAEAAGTKWIGTGLSHGTVTLVIGGSPYEVTTLRRDASCDGRHAEVAFVNDFREDAARRDFTVNAMSADMDGTVHDYFGGADDLAARRIRFVGDADERIAEDHLRILRLFRFRLRYGGGEEAATFEAVRRGADGLERISKERVWSEFSRMLASRAGVLQVALMQELGVCEAVGLRASRLAEAGEAAALGAGAATALGVMTAGNAARAAAAWKLSGAEAAAAAAAEAVALDGETDPGYWKRKTALGLNPRVSSPVLAATGRTRAAAAVAEPIPDFPLRGADLVAEGLEPGPAMGRALAAARGAWMDGGFRADRETLLGVALASVESPSPGIR